MYDFLFGFFYSYYKKRNDSQSLFTASSIVFIAIGFHLLMIHAIIRFVTGYNFNLYDGSFKEKMIGYLIIIPILYLFYLFCKKRSEQVLSRYNNMPRNKTRDIIKVVLLLLLPLVLCIILSNLYSMNSNH